MKRKVKYLVIDKDTGEILSKHKSLTGPNNARLWCKAFRDAGFNAVIRPV